MHETGWRRKRCRVARRGPATALRATRPPARSWASQASPSPVRARPLRQRFAPRDRFPRGKSVSPREFGRARLPRGRSVSPWEIGFPAGDRSGPTSPWENDCATGRDVRVYRRIVPVVLSACRASGGVNPGLAVSAELASASHAIWQQFNFWLQNHAKNRLFPPRSQDPTITRRVRLQCPDRLRRETNHDIRGVRQLRPHPRLRFK